MTCIEVRLDILTVHDRAFCQNRIVRVLWCAAAGQLRSCGRSLLSGQEMAVATRDIFMGATV